MCESKKKSKKRKNRDISEGESLQKQHKLEEETVVEELTPIQKRKKSKKKSNEKV